MTAEPEGLRDAILDMKALMIQADDQARAMSDQELGELLLSGRWTTIEVHEAGRRLKGKAVSK